MVKFSKKARLFLEKWPCLKEGVSTKPKEKRWLFVEESLVTRGVRVSRLKALFCSSCLGYRRMKESERELHLVSN